MLWANIMGRRFTALDYFLFELVFLLHHAVKTLNVKHILHCTCTPEIIWNIGYRNVI